MKTNTEIQNEDMQFLSLASIAKRWDTSRSTARRILQRNGVTPVYLGGSARNSTVRYRQTDVLMVEKQSSAKSAFGCARSEPGSAPGFDGL